MTSQEWLCHVSSGTAWRGSGGTQQHRKERLCFLVDLSWLNWRFCYRCPAWSLSIVMDRRRRRTSLVLRVDAKCRWSLALKAWKISGNQKAVAVDAHLEKRPRTLPNLPSKIVGLYRHMQRHQTCHRQLPATPPRLFAALPQLPAVCLCGPARA